MRPNRIVRSVLAAGVAVWAAQAIAARETIAEQASVETEVLTRGPIHEAFATPVIFDPTPGVVVSEAPSKPIEEVPPDQRPEGDDVTWIPGYWSWDDERNDFIWVSGIWRHLPPGRQWVPGYWAKADGGYQWVSGYWAAATAKTVRYLPPPPASVEAGPSSPEPSPDHMWIPGCWVWREAAYAWRPGYWIGVDPDWVWEPAHYVWTPGGHVFVGGYWDYGVVRRGLLFAPMYASRVVYTRPGFVYRPGIVIDVNLAMDHWFSRPRHMHYYFGDYYSASYFRAGIYPSFSFHYSRYGYDPIYAHRRVIQVRRDPGWEVHLRRQYLDRRERVVARPARTYVAQRTVIGKAEVGKTNTDTRNLTLGRPLSQVGTRKESSVRLSRVDEAGRNRIRGQATAINQYRRQRRDLDGQMAGSAKTGKPRVGKPATPPQRELPRSPFVARPGPRPGGVRSMPAGPSIPRPDAGVRPLPRGKVGPRYEPKADLMTPRILKQQERPNRPQPRPRARSKDKK